MKFLKAIVISAVMMGGSMSFVQAGELLHMQSHREFKETVTHLRDGLAAKGMHIFAEIDHAAQANNVGLSMPATTVLIFGNPKAGTPLMLSAPDVALDLPLRVLIRQNGERVEVLMHPVNDLNLPQELKEKLSPVEALVKSLVESR